MINFQYERANDVPEAVRLIGRNPNAKFIAGGTNLIDLMKMDVEQPTTIIDITRLPLKEVESMPSGGLHIGALVRNTDLAYHPLVEQRYPVLASAIMAGASQQLRNMASTGKSPPAYALPLLLRHSYHLQQTRVRQRLLRH
jgi:xanthine dehydrogenase YagS FAD-binding subunit